MHRCQWVVVRAVTLGGVGRPRLILDLADLSSQRGGSLCLGSTRRVSAITIMQAMGSARACRPGGRGG